MAINHPTQHKRSSTTGNAPVAGDLKTGEIGINFADRVIYTEDPTGNVITLADDVIVAAVAPIAAVSNASDLWFSTTDNLLRSWDGTNWVNVFFDGPQVTAINTVSAAGFSSGSGSSGDPYIMNNVSVPAGGKVVANSISISNLVPGQYVPILDLNNNGNMWVSNNIADSNGTLNFTIEINDSVVSPAGTTFNYQIQIGSATVYINLQAVITVAFPQSITAPTSSKASMSPWISRSDTLTSSGDVLISVDGVNFSQGPIAISLGENLYTKYDGAPGGGTLIDQAEGATVAGSVITSNTASTSVSLTIDKTPDAFTWVDVTNIAESSVSVSNKITVTGISSYAYITGTTTGTVLEYSKNGGGWTAVPAAATATDYVELGDILQVRHVNSASAGTTSDATINIGSTSDIYSSTTVLGPNVATPSILTPLDSAVVATSLYVPVNNVFTLSGGGVEFTADAYTAVNGAGVHASTDWEIYDDAGLTNLVDSSYNDTTNLTTWSSSVLQPESWRTYYIRVKYRSVDPLESNWSTAVFFTTTSAKYLYPLSNTAIDPTIPSGNPGIGYTSGYEFVPNEGFYTSTPATDLTYTFYNNGSFNDPDVSLWDVSSVQYFNGLFDATSFNQDLSGWNVSNAVNMSAMFSRSNFDQDLSTWNTGNVTDMSWMFSDCPFNQSLGAWATWSVTTTEGMFAGNTAFNQMNFPWFFNSFAVTNMSMMFAWSVYSHDLSLLGVSNVLFASDFSILSPIDGNAAFHPSNGFLGNFDLL